VNRRNFLSSTVVGGIALWSTFAGIRGVGRAEPDQHSTSEGIVPVATRVADFIDRHRRLPDEYTLDGQSVSGGQFCRAILAKVVDLGADDAVNITLPESVAAPADPYPDISISVGSRVYERYLELFTQILRRTDPTFPPDIELMGGDLRYVDLVHLAARILRFYDLHSYLPSSLELKVTSPINLFVNSLQWQTPLKYTTFTNPLDSDAGHEGSDAVGDNNRVRYYGHRSMDFPFIKLAVDIVEGIYDPYEAANELYDWVMGNWQRQDRITSAQPTMGRSPSAYEWVRYFMHSSAYPAFEITSLFRAAGIPAKAYTDGPKAYFESRGWEEFHVHDSERFWREEQGYQADLPLPKADDRLMSNAGSILARGRERGAPGDRSVWLNPRDATTRDPQDLVTALSQSGYDRLSLTVKPASGNLYYGSEQYPDRVVTDALGEVVSAAAEGSIDVAAAVNVLFDMRAVDQRPEWQSVDWQDFSTNGIVNLTSSGYEVYVSDLLTEVTETYDVDGIVLSRLYDRQHQSMNEETARAFAQETGRPLGEMVNFDERRIDPEFLRWKMAYTRQYAERLRQRVQDVREIPVTYVSYPIPGGYYQLRRFKQYEDISPFTGGYHFHPEHVRKLAGAVVARPRDEPLVERSGEGRRRILPL